MRRRKGVRKPRSSLSPLLEEAARWLWGRGRTWALLAVVLGGFFGTWQWAWQQYGDKVLARNEYRLRWENVNLTPLPDWIHHTNICADVFRNASLNDPQHPVSLLDDDLVERIKNDFSLHPWIGRVLRVEKQYPGRVIVDVVYRRPVCVVEARGELVPVDEEGWVLPKDGFSNVELTRYPRLLKVESRPLGPEGRPWGDTVVVGGAEIAAAVSAVWEKMDLDHIEPSRSADSSRDQDVTYQLFTRKRTSILWGRAPSSASTIEPSAAEKVAKLEHYLAEHGTLEGGTGPNRLDLTRSGSIQILHETAQKPDLDRQKPR